MFSSSRIEKLSSDLVAYFSSPVSSYLSYDLNQRSSLRVSFWKGLHQGLNGTLNESIYISNIEKCMEHLFFILPVPNCDSRPEAGLAGSMQEWLEAIRCLSKAPHQWLMAMLQVPDINQFHEKDNLDEVAKLITARVRLVRIGCLPISELAKLKSYILSARSEGVWWNVLIDVVAAVSAAEVTLRRQWLLDALEISCIAEHPSTAMWFVGLLSGSCSQYMPLLVADPDSVLRDLQVTLPSLLLKSSWSPVAESVADKLWTAMERICAQKTESTSAGGGVCLPGQDHISESEARSFTSLARAVQQACISLKDYLPLHKQLRLANMEAF
ncbi:protein RST1 isoform X1 [Iris pallida]|uniref:Protein RST1 isoform X1 n=1 Tax=Iris pallida TaxID=29817 RepID=A0AAX6F1Y3_IRIPA|nr:protein RST1 isoform X1 [Iris pallida]